MSSAPVSPASPPIFVPSLTLVIPAFNEAENLPLVLPQALQFVSEQCRDARLLIVDDGSADATPEVLKAYADHPRVRLIRHPQNRGLTATLRTGFSPPIANTSPGFPPMARSRRPRWPRSFRPAMARIRRYRPIAADPMVSCARRCQRRCAC